MSDPLFDSRSSRHDLPYIFAGQSQKEGYVNEVTARLDALLHLAVEGEANTPPATPSDGQAWLVGTAPIGAWSGHAGNIAAREKGMWLFFVPRDGMRILDRSTSQDIRFQSTWRRPLRPALAAGGSTIDAEARATIAAIVDCLTLAGLLAPS